MKHRWNKSKTCVRCGLTKREKQVNSVSGMAYSTDGFITFRFDAGDCIKVGHNEKYCPKCNKAKDKGCFAKEGTIGKEAKLKKEKHIYGYEIVFGYIKYLGCTRAFWLKYLEEKFKPGMTWENYGKVWEVDHKIPISSVDKLDNDRLIPLFHWSNTQPLFKEENRKKRNLL